MISVVAWIVSVPRPLIFGVAPYNLILGETHHVSRGNLNILLEQVSHHPPVSALHATDEQQELEMIWCQQPVPKFYDLMEEHGHIGGDGGSWQEAAKPREVWRILYYEHAEALDPVLARPFGRLGWPCEDHMQGDRTQAEMHYKHNVFGRRNSLRSVSGRDRRCGPIQARAKFNEAGHCL
ncbi:hypothetical protein SAY87_026401 [Trapa incisa]|uniref:Uncharacterized protein n=1 Tax=Trapa incisa TaxID=236973 RepID=A0AAN7GRX3_9MYRT|nr:hypothetical protein SAY87_026401 [Trapa incisa]